MTLLESLTQVFNSRLLSQSNSDGRQVAARNNLLDFSRHIMPGYQVNWHHRVLCAYLDRFAAGEIRRLMVFMPPRHGKSQLVSRHLPAFILGRNPDAQLIATSYGADLSSRMNRDVQRIVENQRYQELFPDTRLNSKNVRAFAQGIYLRNSDIFEIVGHKGSYRSAGRGGGITGMGGNFLLIDDPLKDRAEANSEAIREGLWEWYTSTLYTRQEKDAGILIVMTRWHLDDLAGRLLAMDEAGEGEGWTVLSFPALAEPMRHADDPREVGDPLWPDKYSLETLTRIRANIGSYEWNALYQQSPIAGEGGAIKREWLAGTEKIVGAVPREARRVRYWDKAGTEGGGKFSAGVLIAAHDGYFYIEDVVRGQWSAHNREKVIRQTAELDGDQYGRHGIGIYIEQEPGSGGKESAEYTIRNLAGFSIHADRPSGDKDTRLIPFAAQAEAGNVLLKRGLWNMAYIDELCAIPYGVYRDQGDATAGAFNRLADHKAVRQGNAPRVLVNFRGG